MKRSTRIISPADLSTGDVLICSSNSKKNPIPKIISQNTRSKYTHAAIYVGDGNIAESTLAGPRKTKITEWLTDYAYVAVFRQPEAWTNHRKQALRIFLDEHAYSKWYNFRGVLSYTKEKKAHDENIHDKLIKHFAGELPPESTIKPSYFCSELVVDCFVEVGILDQSAAVLFKSNTTSPGDLGRDTVFGFFYGYLTPQKEFLIPSDDEFYNAVTFDEIKLQV